MYIPVVVQELELHESSILFGSKILSSWGYSILYKEYNLTGFNHQTNATHDAFEHLRRAVEQGSSHLAYCAP